MTNSPPPEDKQRVSKEVWLAAIEVVVGGGLAFLVNQQLGSDPIANASGLIVGSFAALHGLHRVITVFETTKSMNALERAVHGLRRRVDSRMDDTESVLSSRLQDSEDHLSSRLSELANRVGLGEIADLYWSIDREFDVDKNAIIAEAKEKLYRLRTTKESSPMYKASYYTWITENIARVGRGGKITAISRMKSTEWENSPEEKNFFAQNRAAAEAGAIIERVFVAPKAVLEQGLSGEMPTVAGDVNVTRVFKAHSSSESNSMMGWFADEERLEKEDPDLLERIGDGFLMFRYGKSGDRVALIDEFTEDDEARGRVTKNEAEIARLEQSFENLKSMSARF